MKTLEELKVEDSIATLISAAVAVAKNINNRDRDDDATVVTVTALIDAAEVAIADIATCEEMANEDT